MDAFLCLPFSVLVLFLFCGLNWFLVFVFENSTKNQGFRCLDEVLFCLNSNRVASFTSATCSVRFGEALINLVPQVGDFSYMAEERLKRYFLRFMTWKPAIQMYMIYIPTGLALGLDWKKSRYSFHVFGVQAKTNQNSVLFGGIKNILGGN